jgi:hypothetical protein
VRRRHGLRHATVVQDLDPQSSSSIIYGLPSARTSLLSPSPVTTWYKSTAGSGSDKEVTLKDVVARLATIEDIVQPLQPLHDQVTTLQATVADQQQ